MKRLAVNYDTLYGFYLIELFLRLQELETQYRREKEEADLLLEQQRLVCNIKLYWDFLSQQHNFGELRLNLTEVKSSQGPGNNNIIDRLLKTRQLGVCPCTFPQEERVGGEENHQSFLGDGIGKYGEDRYENRQC